MVMHTLLTTCSIYILLTIVALFRRAIFLKKGKEMNIERLCRVTTTLALSFVMIFFFTASYNPRKYKEPLAIGEVTLFIGPYCQDKDTALLIGRAFEANFKKGVSFFRSKPLCIRIIRLITVLNVIEDFGTYRVIKVRYANTLKGYLITSTKVVGDEPA